MEINWNDFYWNDLESGCWGLGLLFLCLFYVLCFMFFVIGGFSDRSICIKNCIRDKKDIRYF